MVYKGVKKLPLRAKLFSFVMLLAAVMVTLSPLGVRALTFESQPDGTAGQDTWIDGTNLNDNWSTQARVAIGESTTLDNGTTRGLIRFDVSSIPSNATVSSATLTLWLSHAGTTRASNNRTIQAYRLRSARDWVEGQATWNVYKSSGGSWSTAGAANTTSDREAVSIGSANLTTASAANSQHVFTLDADAVQDWIDGELANNGLILIADTELNDQYWFHSSDGTTAQYRPKLTIEYTVPTLDAGILIFTSVGSTAITASSTGASDAGGLAALPYTYHNSTAGTYSAPTSTPWVSSGLTPNTAYSFAVGVQNAAGEWATTSPSVSTTTLAKAPSGIAFSVDSANQITVSWNANSNPAGTEYYVSNTTAGTNSGWITATSWSSTSLSPATSYSFSVKARNSAAIETTAISGSTTTDDAVQTLYVSPSGAGSHDGSSGNEMTLSEALDYADDNGGGQTLLLKPGSYGDVVIDRGYGSLDGNTVIKADPGTTSSVLEEGWWLDESVVETPSASSQVVFNSLSFASRESGGAAVGHYVTLDGINIVRTTTGGNAITFGQYVSHVEVKNCGVFGKEFANPTHQKLTDFTQNGILMYHWQPTLTDWHNITIDSCYFEWLLIGAQIYGKAGDNVIIKDSHFYWMENGGFSLRNFDHPGADIQILRNHIHAGFGTADGADRGSWQVSSVGSPSNTTFVHAGSDPTYYDYVGITLANNGGTEEVRRISSYNATTNTAIVDEPFSVAISVGDNIEFYDGDHGSGIAVSGDYITISGNVMHDIGNSGMLYSYHQGDGTPPHDILIENNLLYDPPGYSMAPLDLGGSTSNTMGNNVVIRNNTIIGQVWSTGQTTLLPNAKWNYGQGFNMTVDDSADISTVEVRNNLIVGGSQIEAGVVENNALYFSNAGYETDGSGDNKDNVVYGGSYNGTYTWEQGSLFEFNENWFTGGDGFDVTFQTGNHGQTFYEEFRPLATSDACNGTILAAGTAVGALSCPNNVTTYTITASAGANGSISPSGSVSVTEGEDRVFTITPSSGYRVATLVIDSISVSTSTSYTFTNVTDDHTIAVTFEAIPASGGGGEGGSGGSSGGGRRRSSGGSSRAVATTTPAAAAPSTLFVFARDLAVGSEGPDVAALQDILIARGYLIMPPGIAKGYFGNLTQAALMKYQQAQGIAPASGYFGPVTRARIVGTAQQIVPAAASSTPTIITTLTQSLARPLTLPLSLGSQNGDVLLLQQFLISRGFLPAGNATGYFGPLTRTAVGQFQVSQGIVASPADSSYGLVGPATRGRINGMR